MKKLLRAGLLLGLSSLAVSAHAEDSTWETESRPYLSVLYSYTFDSSDKSDTDAGQGAQLGFGNSLSKHWGYELNAFYTEFPHDDSPGAIAQREYGGKADLLYFYSRNRHFSPYFGLGLGGVYTKLRGTSLDSTDPFGDAGIGFISYFNLAGADLGFRADLRYRHIYFGNNDLNNSDNVGEAVLKVGLVVPLGGRPVAAASTPSAPPAACTDSDGDGICDTADLCPGTPSGAVVDAKGCPKATAEGATRKFDDVHFEFDKSELAAQEQAKLDNTANTISGLSKTYPNLKVDVSGHTDWIGTDGYNQGLSERRANTVKSYLSRKGVDAGRINTFAYGESKPIATNETAEGRAQNRRVEVQTHE